MLHSDAAVEGHPGNVTSASYHARCVEVVKTWRPGGELYSQLLLVMLSAIVAT